jgi:ribonuclease R
LRAVKGRDDASVIQTVMLRSMSQAVYQPENLGHFGLAFDAYTHFTSPIRRYADLLVHRAIRSLIRGNKKIAQVQRFEGVKNLPTETIYPYELGRLQETGEHLSVTERRADEATRDVVNWLKCEYLMDRVGEEYNGLVSAVTGFGLFVMLDELYVEGLIHVTGLPKDYYYHEASQHRMIGERTGRVFRLGQQLTVKVVRVNLEERKIDFELVEAGQTSSQPAPKSNQSRKKKSSGKGGELPSAPGKNTKRRGTRGNSDSISSKKKPASRKRKPGAKKSRTGSPNSAPTESAGSRKKKKPQS